MTYERLLLDLGIYCEQVAIPSKPWCYKYQPEGGDIMIITDADKEKAAIGMTQALVDHGILTYHVSDNKRVIQLLRRNPAKSGYFVKKTSIRDIVSDGDQTTNSRPWLTIHVIYKNPKDYPNKWVVREWNGLIPNKIACCDANSLMEARKHIPKGLFNIGRRDGDDPIIEEIWI